MKVQSNFYDIIINSYDVQTQTVMDIKEAAKECAKLCLQEQIKLLDRFIFTPKNNGGINHNEGIELKIRELKLKIIELNNE